MNSASAHPQVSIKSNNYNIKPSRICKINGNFVISLIFSEFRLSGKQRTLPKAFSFVMKFVLLLKQTLLLHKWHICYWLKTFCVSLCLVLGSWQSSGCPSKDTAIPGTPQMGNVLSVLGDSAMPTDKRVNRRTDSVQTYLFGFLPLFLDLESLFFGWVNVLYQNHVLH